jgi:hypothetical protein
MLRRFAPDYFVLIRHYLIPDPEIHDGGKTGPVLGLEKAEICLAISLVWSKGTG